MKLRQYLIPIGLCVLLTALLHIVCYWPLVRVVQEVAAWILPTLVPDSGYAVTVTGLSAGMLAMPGLILLLVLDKGLTSHVEGD